MVDVNAQISAVERELHLEDGVAVARGAPYPADCATHVGEADDRVLVNGPHFTLLHYHGGGSEKLADRERWIVPLGGLVRAGEEEAGPGDCLFLEAGREVSGDGAFLLAAADSADVAQCRTFDSASGSWSGDTCVHAGGLDQNIYGDSTP